MRTGAPFFVVLFTKKLSQSAQRIAEFIQIQLCLDSLCQCFDLIVGKINFQKFLQNTDGVFLELFKDLIVSFDLFYNFLNLFFQFCFNIHGNASFYE